MIYWTIFWHVVLGHVISGDDTRTLYGINRSTFLIREFQTCLICWERIKMEINSHFFPNLFSTKWLRLLCSDGYSIYSCNAIMAYYQVTGTMGIAWQHILQGTKITYQYEQWPFYDEYYEQTIYANIYLSPVLIHATKERRDILITYLRDIGVSH